MDDTVVKELDNLEALGVRVNPYRAGRPVTMGRHGMISSPNMFASLAGLDVLRDKGTAMDAAVAAAAVLAVTEPGMTGLGGDLFFLYYDAVERKVYACNGTGHSPGGLGRVHFNGRREIDPHAWEAVTVPGTVDGWVEGVNRFGSKSLGDLLGPAIQYAEKGFPVSAHTARIWQWAGRSLEKDTWTRQTFLLNGKAPVPGQVFSNPDLAASLRQVAEGGREAFYKGPIAREIVRYAAESGGFLTMDDFRIPCQHMGGAGSHGL